MNILWHNKTCIEINAASKKGGAVNIIIDPQGKEEKGKKISGDVFLFTEKEKQRRKEPFIIDGPGEYEIKEVYIRGFEVSSLKTFYTILAEDIILCHLGFFNEDELSGSQIEELGNVDILFLPINKEQLDTKKAAKIISQLEPKIIIPIDYETSKDKNLKEFLDVLEMKAPEPVSKLSIKKKLIEENSKVVILNS